MNDTKTRLYLTKDEDREILYEYADMNGLDVVACPRCDGTGTRQFMGQTPTTPAEPVDCRHCHGLGLVTD